MRRTKCRQSGFTMIELMIVIVVVGIGLALAIPNYGRAVNKRAVINAAEQTSAALLSAKSLAVKYNEPITVTVARDGANSWCLVAAASTAVCDCTQEGFDCNGDADGSTIIADPTAGDGAIGEEVEIYLAGLSGDNDSDFERASMTSLSQNPLGLTFDPVRGILTADNQPSGSLSFLSENQNFELRVNVSVIGNVNICAVEDSANDKYGIGGYPTCAN